MDPYMHDTPSPSVKINPTQKVMEDEEEEDQEEFGGVEQEYHDHEESNFKKTKVIVAGVPRKERIRGCEGVALLPPPPPPPCCQVEMCGVDLADAKKYHKRHKVCESHAKAPVVIVAGSKQRFCQQCSRFHVLSEFDDTKRSCRQRLAGHNERRRKSSSECRGGGSGRGGSNQYVKDDECRQVNESQRSQRAFPGGSSMKTSIEVLQSPM